MGLIHYVMMQLFLKSFEELDFAFQFAASFILLNEVSISLFRLLSVRI